jgi:hypothetical protein
MDNWLKLIPITLNDLLFLAIAVLILVFGRLANKYLQKTIKSLDKSQTLRRNSEKWIDEETLNNLRYYE